MPFGRTRELTSFPDVIGVDVIHQTRAAVLEHANDDQNFVAVKLVARILSGSGGAVWSCRHVQGLRVAECVPGPATVKVSATTGPLTTIWIPLSITGVAESEFHVGAVVFAAKKGDQLYGVWPPIRIYTTE